MSIHGIKPIDKPLELSTIPFSLITIPGLLSNSFFTPKTKHIPKNTTEIVPIKNKNAGLPKNARRPERLISGGLTINQIPMATKIKAPIMRSVIFVLLNFISNCSPVLVIEK